MNGQHGDTRCHDEEIISFVHEFLRTNRQVLRPMITFAVIDKFTIRSVFELDESVKKAIRSVCPYSFDIKCERNFEIERSFFEWSSSGVSGRSVLTYDGGTIRSVQVSSGSRRLDEIDCWSMSAEIEEEAALFALTLPVGTEIKKTRG